MYSEKILRWRFSLEEQFKYITRLISSGIKHNNKEAHTNCLRYVHDLGQSCFSNSPSFLYQREKKWSSQNNLNTQFQCSSLKKALQLGYLMMSAILDLLVFFDMRSYAEDSELLLCRAFDWSAGPRSLLISWTRFPLYQSKRCAKPCRPMLKFLRALCASRFS